MDTARNQSLIASSFLFSGQTRPDYLPKYLFSVWEMRAAMKMVLLFDSEGEFQDIFDGKT